MDATPSLVDLMGFLMKQSERMNAVMEMLALDRRSATPEKSQLANCKLDEKYFRKVPTFNNTRSGWKEWRRHFLNALRECDVDWAEMVETLETMDEPIDNIRDYTPIQNQLSTNLYNRLIAFTTGTAFQIVESVPDHNGGEAWRLLSHQFDPKTDARLTNLVLSIIGHKIKGKDVAAGIVLWEAQLLQLERDHQERFSEKIRRAFLMNVLPSTLQGKIMEHLDRLKTYKEVRDKVTSLCGAADDADIGNLDAQVPESPPDNWDGWWQDDVTFGWHEPEPAEEQVDVQALADMRCHVCGGMGHLARHCASPNPKGGGKGGKSGGKGSKGKGGGKGGKGGVKNPRLICATCGKAGHLKDRCFVRFTQAFLCSQGPMQTSVQHLA